MADRPEYEEGLLALMAGVSDRLAAELGSRAPRLGEIVRHWTTGLSPGDRPEEYFTYPSAYPIFLLPWWLERSLAPPDDPGFMADIVESTMCGYYHIRLLDDLMDGEATGEIGLLPAAGIFHERFQSSYQAHFPAEHPFWEIFRDEWFACAEATVLDHRLTEIDLPTFVDVSARKMRAALIPVAAVCLHHGRAALVDRWRPYCDLLARCVQMTDDVFDWHLDLRRANGTTYFLSEARRRKRTTESISAWVLREGWEWGVSRTRDWLCELRGLASQLDCPPAALHVERRLATLDERHAALAPGHAALAQIADGLERGT
ncbi:MAG: class 1 isoprenoid biosynthesis enzyme [Gemmatimonadales bacterium]|jgi:hypothetical protein